VKRLGTPTTTVADVMKALSDPTRWAIIQQMAETDELPCAVLESTLPLSKPTISYHTNILLKAGLITARKAGRNFFYSLNRDVIDELMNELWVLAPRPGPVQPSRVNHRSTARRNHRADDTETGPQDARGDAPLLTW
jgi:DNA-binding transcriptional ArsR family regulator